MHTSTHKIRYILSNPVKKIVLHNIAVLYTYIVCVLTVGFCSQDGCTALHLAAEEGQVDVVRLLTESQAQVHIQTEVHVILFTTSCYLC